MEQTVRCYFCLNGRERERERRHFKKVFGLRMLIMLILAECRGRVFFRKQAGRGVDRLVYSEGLCSGPVRRHLSALTV